MFLFFLTFNYQKHQSQNLFLQSLLNPLFLLFNSLSHFFLKVSKLRRSFLELPIQVSSRCVCARVCMCVLPVSLGDDSLHFSTPVAGVRDFEQILIIFKHLNGSTKAKKNFFLMYYFLLNTNTYTDGFSLIREINTCNFPSRYRNSPWLWCFFF